MKFLRDLWRRSRRSLRFSVENPRTFRELWSFNSTALKVVSLLLVIQFLIALAVLYLFSGSFNEFKGTEVSIERTDLEKQREEIDELTKKLDAQERYIVAVRRILSGEVPIDSDPDSLYLAEKKFDNVISDMPSETESALAEKVREDAQLTGSRAEDKVSNFVSPVKGVISQKFDKKGHPGIDVVTKKDELVKTCLPGTVIYAGYTRKDGYIVLVDHSNGFISVYKHNKTILRKTGDNVKIGDPLAIVGNTGENTDGPHLHFELWYNQNPVNPADYIYFRQ